MKALPTAKDQPILSGFAPVSQQDDVEDDDSDTIVVDANFDEEDRSKRQARFHNKNPSSPFQFDLRNPSFTCGTPSVNFEPPQNRRFGRIINGVDAPLGAYPWQVARNRINILV